MIWQSIRFQKDVTKKEHKSNVDFLIEVCTFNYKINVFDKGIFGKYRYN